MIEKHVMNNLNWICAIVFQNLYLFYFIGEVGDWKNHFSAEEDAAFEEHYHKIMANCPIPIQFTV